MEARKAIKKKFNTPYRWLSGIPVIEACRYSDSLSSMKADAEATITPDNVISWLINRKLANRQQKSNMV